MFVHISFNGDIWTGFLIYFTHDSLLTQNSYAVFIINLKVLRYSLPHR